MSRENRRRRRGALLTTVRLKPQSNLSNFDWVHHLLFRFPRLRPLALLFPPCLKSISLSIGHVSFGPASFSQFLFDAFLYSILLQLYPVIGKRLSCYQQYSSYFSISTFPHCKAHLQVVHAAQQQLLITCLCFALNPPRLIHSTLFALLQCLLAVFAHLGLRFVFLDGLIYPMPTNVGDLRRFGSPRS